YNHYKVAAVIDGVSRSPLITARTDENGELILTVSEPMYLYRAEYYSGAYAVINAGVGSCTTRRYLEQFYHDSVQLFNPCCIIAEAHSINDWLNHIPPEEAKANLVRILTGCPNAVPILVTVAPIAGETAQPFSDIDYEEYIAVSREAALENGFSLVDANRAIGNGHFSDNWHPDEEGHAIYFREILKVLDTTILP
ncbi:MAG: SGNH/GDSL hydrolase family protein, partial [Eubacteriales bacterium]